MKKHITYCNQCDNCKVYPDPDFDDWFCHDDVKIVCNVNNMTMASACRPYEINSFKVPKNCPLMNKMEEKPIKNTNDLIRKFMKDNNLEEMHIGAFILEEYNSVCINKNDIDKINNIINFNK